MIVTSDVIGHVTRECGDADSTQRQCVCDLVQCGEAFVAESCDRHEELLVRGARGIAGQKLGRCNPQRLTPIFSMEPKDDVDASSPGKSHCTCQCSVKSRLLVKHL
jgi:hypothetical protein